MAKWVYLFREGNADMRNLLGGKGANLAEMTNLGLPIPPGFTVTTEACTDYYNHGRSISEEIQTQIFDALALLEEKLGKKFGDTENPLLVSVRSGARASRRDRWSPYTHRLFRLHAHSHLLHVQHPVHEMSAHGKSHRYACITHHIHSKWSRPDTRTQHPRPVLLNTL